MKETHIILRNLRHRTRDFFLGDAVATPAESAPNLVLEIEDVERNQLPALSRRQDVVAIAPSMPVKLIAPVDVSEAPAGEAKQIAWGIKAVGADSSPFSGDGVVVAVLDTGIDAKHSAFAGVDVTAKNFTDDVDPDVHGHGTHCAGTIFGRDVLGTRIGVAPDVKKALIGKVLGPNGGSSAQIVKAINWAIENGAQIISMSLGMDFPGMVKQLIEKAGFPAELATSRALENYRANVQLFERLASLVRAQAAFNGPVLITAAAGNESRRDKDQKFEIGVSPPAVAEGIISVAAVGQTKDGLTVAPFSNTGANVSGPGVQISSAKLGGGLANMSGTSMATPHVAGVAALWAEKMMKARHSINLLQWSTNVLGSANTEDFAPGFNPFNIGAGLIRAPR